MSKKGKQAKKDDDPAMLVAMGKQHHRAGRLQQAESIYRQVLRQSPRHAASLHYLGLIMHQRGQSSEALTLIRKSIKQNPRDAESHNNLGNVLRRLGMPEEAVPSFKRAIKLSGEFAGAYSNLGLTYRQLGRFEEAAEQFRLALHHQPELAEAWSGLARTGRLGFSADEAEAAEQVFDNPALSDGDRRHMAYALGKHHDATGDFDRAFGFYEQANRLSERAENTKNTENKGATAKIVSGLLDTDFSATEKKKKKEKKKKSPEAPESLESSAYDNLTPIFIFGMPRSGTTLVEQILSSHRDVEACGELNVIDASLRRLCPGLEKGNADALTRLDADDRKTLRSAFYAAVQERIGEGGAQMPKPSFAPSFVTDKSLLNFAYVPVLRLVFPDARFVHCRRDARDTCLSMYFTDFRAVYDFTNDLGDIGRFYVLYTRTMKKWESLFPDMNHEIGYENVIGQQEIVTRRLLEYCGLPWDRACLNFFETKRQVATPSDWQVRLPVFTSSRGRWKNYDKHITPLQEALKGTT